MTIQKLLTTSYKKLKKAEIDSANLDAVILLYHVLRKPKAYLFTHPEKLLTSKQIENYNKLIQRRLKHEPIAYLTGHKEFYGFDFLVNKNVMIPRPETELLIDQVIKTGNKIFNIVDVGTGSGCVSVTLAKKLSRAKILTTDISKKALALAKKNAAKHQVSKKINFYQGNLLEPVKNQKIDLLVANLPYLSKKEYLHSPFARELSFEPTAALTDRADGLSLFQEIFDQLGSFSTLKKSLKYLALEIGYEQAADIKKLVKKVFPKATMTIIKDFCGFDRVLIAKI
ncbi:MAG TPA: peptide chain release factor N(5)-glutamine methyltransferase [Patescibacteria group bacterium]